MRVATGATLSRASLLRRSAVGGTALAVSGGVFSAVAQSAPAATPPDGDLAYLRLLVGAELLAVDFQTNALASGKLPTAQTAVVKQMVADEQAHYAGLSQLLLDAGQTPATAGDINFAYPKDTFASLAAIAKLAYELETLSVGAYLGAVQNVQTASLRLPIGQIAGNEAQHVSAVSSWVGKPAIGSAFAPAWSIAAVSDALDNFES